MLTLRENWRDVGSILRFILGRVSDSGQALLAWLAYLLLVPVVTFYLLRDWDRLVAGVRKRLPQRHEQAAVDLMCQCDDVPAEFLRGQLLVMLALGVVYSVGLWIVGLDFALLIGMLSGMVSFVPYLGTIVGVVVAGVAAFMQFHDFVHLIFVGLVFGAGQALDGLVLSLLLVGDRVGLHPVAVIFAVMAGGAIGRVFRRAAGAAGRRHPHGAAVLCP